MNCSKLLIWFYQKIKISYINMSKDCSDMGINGSISKTIYHDNIY